MTPSLRALRSLPVPERVHLGQRKPTDGKERGTGGKPVALF